MNINRRVPVAGICMLERGAENQIRNASAEELLPMLQKQAYHPLDDQTDKKFLALTKRLSGLVPLWKLSCTKDPQAAHIAYDAMHK